MRVEEFIDTFETERREVYLRRADILAALQLQPGTVVADIGAGTGAFLAAIADALLPQGQLFALDIAPKFVDHLRSRCRDEQLNNVTVRLASAEDLALAPASIDLAFVCDTYHHFEQPAITNAAILRALRPGGRLVVVDFDRDGAYATDWIRDHVRAAKQVFLQEILAVGFVLIAEPDLELRENFMAVFQRP